MTALLWGLVGLGLVAVAVGAAWAEHGWWQTGDHPGGVVDEGEMTDL